MPSGCAGGGGMPADKVVAVEPKDWRRTLHDIIFETDSRAGRIFDVVLIWAIITSVIVVMMESVPAYREVWGDQLHAAEWFFTILFTIEYVLRIVSARRPLAYIRSFYGLVDLLSIVPTYLSILFPGVQSLLVIRGLRLLRIFRVFKLIHFIGEANYLSAALRASGRKIAVFLWAVLTIVTIVGAMMYLIEGEAAGFTSIPHGIYWAIVTMTTVGYGDITPLTFPGRLLASVLMIMGYGIIAVPTGIVTVEMSNMQRATGIGRECPSCGAAEPDSDARFCRFCGTPLGEPPRKDSTSISGPSL